MSEKKDRVKKAMKKVVAGALGTGMVTGALAGMNTDMAGIFYVNEVNAEEQGTTGTVKFDHERYTLYDAISPEHKQKVDIIVDDADRNTSPYSKDQVEVHVYSGSDLTGHIVTLLETGYDTGIFKTSVPVSKGDPKRSDIYLDYDNSKSESGFDSDSYYLKAMPDDILYVEYTDPAGENGQETVVWSTAIVIPHTTGTLSFDADRYRPGDMVTLTLEDPDRNLDISDMDRYTVDIDDRLFVEIIETGADTGIYTGTFSVGELLSKGKNIGDKFYTSIKDRYSESYTDWTMLRAEADIIDYSTGSIALDAGSYNHKRTVNITVEDDDMNRLTSAADTLNVKVKSQSDSTGIEVVLTETGADTGVFTGTVGLTTGDSDQSARLIKAVVDDILTVSYDDEISEESFETRIAQADIDAVPSYVVNAVENDTFSVAIEGEITTLTVKEGVSGLHTFQITITSISKHKGDEIAIFTHCRDGEMLGIQTVAGDFDTEAGQVDAEFDVQPGDKIRIYIADSLTTEPDRMPFILQE